MNDFLLKLYASLTFPLFALLMVSTIWGMVDTFLLLRFQGKMKRGVRLFQKPLPQPTEQFLRLLPNDVFIKRKMFIGEATVGFIRVDRDERLIQTRKPRWRTSWPYVAYVDLSQPVPMLEYRASLPMNLAFVFWFLITIPVPFLWLFFGGLIYWNYHMETKAITEFLQQQQKEYLTGGIKGE